MILIFCSFFISELSKFLLDINSLLYDSLSEQFAIELIDEIFTNMRKWQLVGYLLIPVFLLIKTQVIAGSLGIGVFLFNMDISHKRLWNIALRAEFVFLIPSILKIIWFYFFKTEFELADLEKFYPLSLSNLFEVDTLPIWFHYPLQIINIFEMSYIIFLIFLIDKELKTSINLGVKIVSSSYIPILIIWIVSIMFFILNQT